MNGPVILTVAGHGGLNAHGEYPRKDKRSPEVPPGIFEGAFNRTTAGGITDKLLEDGITCQFVNPGPMNSPHKSIIGYVNDTARRSNRPLALIEVHANSDDVQHYDERGWFDENGQDIETGFVVFVSERASRTSLKLAHAIDAAVRAEGYKIPSRGVKSANFNIITKTVCPAVLIECGFMSNRSDVALLQDPVEIKKLCTAISKAIKAVYSAE